MRVLVVVPTYNEVLNLSTLAERVLATDPALDMLCVDDGSPDGTGDLADELAERHARFEVIHRTGKRGYGPASRDGLVWALDREYDLIATMDADLSHDPASLPALVERAAGGPDLVIGSRYVSGGVIEADWSPARFAVSRWGSAYARAMLRANVRDCTSGFRCYSRRAVATALARPCRSDGYCFLIEVLDAVASAGLRISEIPIRYVDRRHGESKISRRIVLEALWWTTAWGLTKRIPTRSRVPAREIGV